MVINSYDSARSVADEPHWIEFVQGVGGALVAPLITRQGVKNADFIFPAYKTIVEMKIIESEIGLDNNMKERIYKISEKYDSIPQNVAWPKFENEISEILIKPLRRIVTKANQQIKQTKIELNLPAYSGIILLVNDNTRSIDANLMINIVAKAMLRGNFGSTNAVIYLTNHYVAVKGHPIASLLWVPMYRSDDDHHLSDFINWLGRKWFDYVEKEDGPFDGREERDGLDPGALQVASGSYRPF